MARGEKTAFITGSGRNIGRGCAQYLARDGFNVVVNGSANRAACERVADEVRAAGAEALVAMGDIGDAAAIEAMAGEALAVFGRIDVLINNAAIRPVGSFLEIADADLDRVMQVNANAAVRLSRAFLPGMIEAGWGRIVNFTGMNAQRGTADRPHVTMSKHAVWGLTKALAREFGPNGVTVNIISPGVFPGEGGNVQHDGRHAELAAQTPVRRLGRAGDIASLVALLCSEDGGFITGQLLQVNGGVEM